MIYGSTNHPVEVKKVKIKVWSLQDELKAVIRHKINSLGEDGVDKLKTQLEIKELEKQYRGATPSLSLVQGGAVEADGDDGKELLGDASIEALGDKEEDNSEETSEENPEASTEEESDETQAGEEQASQKESKKKTIVLKKPQMSDKDEHQGVAFLCDIQMYDMTLFSTAPFVYGQSVVVEFLIPKRFILNAEVISCKNYNMGSRIISKNRPPFRLHVRFTFLKEGEMTLLRNFLASVQPDIPKDSLKKKVVEEDNDDFDDLGL